MADQAKDWREESELTVARELSVAIEQHADRRSPGQGPQRYGKVAATSLHGCACSSADRALASGARGHRFKSCQARQPSLKHRLAGQAEAGAKAARHSF